jgi:isoleucyl-tRNA synthetase
MLLELDRLVAQVREAYDGYLTHRAFRLLYDFCAVQISAVYGNAMKDRLYCELPDSPLRRRSQTVQWHLADSLIRLLAPMVVFTADEAWEFLPGAEASSVHLVNFPAARGLEAHASYELLMRLRDEALLELDRLKREKGLNKATDGEVVYRLTPADRALLEPYGVDLADVVGAGSHSIADAAGGASRIELIDRRESYGLCARSRKRTADVGSDAEHPDLSARDAAVMRALSRS